MFSQSNSSINSSILGIFFGKNLAMQIKTQEGRNNLVGKTERVVLVKGNGARWYEQAIFIVNKNAPEESIPIDFIAEAERIIDEFNLKNNPPPVSLPLTQQTSILQNPIAQNSGPQAIPKPIPQHTLMPELMTPKPRKKSGWLTSIGIGVGCLLIVALVAFRLL